jgi:hypothetical protein
LTKVQLKEEKKLVQLLGPLVGDCLCNKPDSLALLHRKSPTQRVSTLTVCYRPHTMASNTASERKSSGSGRIDVEKSKIEHLDIPENGSIQDDPTDPIEAKRILRRIDWRLIPLLMFLYTLTFLDRVNIGNARLWNMERDLGMTGYDYNIVVLGENKALSQLYSRVGL